MSAHYSKPLNVAMAVILPLLLISCQSAPTRFFTLEPVTPASNRSPYDGPAIRVENVRVPPTLDRIEILHEVGPGEYKVSDLDRWIAPLGQIAQQTLTSDLVARLPPGRVSVSQPAKAAGVNRISVSLLDSHDGPDGATLHVSWVGTVDEAQGCPRGGTMLLQTALRGSGSAMTARRLSALLGQLADQMVAELSLFAPSQPASPSSCAAESK